MNAPDVDHKTELTVNGDVKLNGHTLDQESDARHEPGPLKLLDASLIPQVGTPVDPDSIPIHPPHGTPPPPEGELLPEVQMAEQEPPHTNGLNGINGDVNMAEPDEHTPATTPGVNDTLSASQLELNDSSAYTTPNVDLEDDKPPPAKRARVHSDADRASIAHSVTPPPASTVTSNSTTPVPPPSASAPIPGPSTFSQPQFRFCQSVLRILKKQKDAVPFLRPVDPVSLNIPHYPTIIKNPMDFSTIERKLGSSNPLKPDPNAGNPRYLSGEDFVSDVRLIFSNCLAFNGPDHAVSNMGKRVEEVFDKQIKNMPASDIKPVVRKATTPPPPAPPVQLKKGQAAARRNSTVIPTIRRSDTELIGRPKREIHPPPPKDLPYADAPKKHRKSKRVRDGANSEQMKFCSKLLDGMFNKKQYSMAHPFYEPVDWVKLDLPAYPKIVKKPMDLSTMRKKLENGEYPTAEKFFDDFKLMIRNCFSFNPAGTPVNQAGIELQRYFDDKWKNLPSVREAPSDDEDEDEEDESDDDRARTIAMMESQIETMRNSISVLKSAKPVKEKKKKEKRDKLPTASSSKASSKPGKSSTSKKKGKKPIADDDVLTYDQKKDLSEAIGALDGTKLERVIQIIHDGVPEIRDSTEEIELDIDLLPAAVLTKLHNFVIRRPPTTKRNRPGKGTGTGGLKRKSMDEDVEAEKIRQLEQRMKLFEGAPNGYSAQTPKGDDSERSSDSSSGSDSSGSDSE